ncbi:MAG: zinc ribbon domain-containing protein [Oscillospiraceae bacterium]|nr:zinc ribbon domain-containing protein [Oscillospiraceae bacterium]
MAKKIIGYGDRYCTSCGAAMEKQTQICPHCGQPYDVSQRCAQISPLGAGGIGWSTQTAHPSFKKYAGKNRIASVIFAAVVCVIIFIVMLVKGDMELNSKGIRIFGLVMAVLWSFWIIWMIVSAVPKKDWDGVVGQKESRLEEYYDRSTDGDRSSFRQTRMKYIVPIRKANGGVKKIVEYDRTVWYEYLLEGETVRYHGRNMSYYEKYDKSRDTFLLCAGCTAKRDPRENFCGRCGCILLKGQPVQAAVPMQPPVMQPPVMQQQFCRSCGQPIMPGKRFCGSCGTPV